MLLFTLNFLFIFWPSSYDCARTNVTFSFSNNGVNWHAYLFKMTSHHWSGRSTVECWTIRVCKIILLVINTTHPNRVWPRKEEIALAFHLIVYLIIYIFNVIQIKRQTRPGSQGKLVSVSSLLLVVSDGISNQFQRHSPVLVWIFTWYLSTT